MFKFKYFPNFNYLKAELSPIYTLLSEKVYVDVGVRSISIVGLGQRSLKTQPMISLI